MTNKAPAQLTSDRYVARFRAARAVLEQHYCTLFKFWRNCPVKRCRRARLCRGDAHACLTRRVNEVSRHSQFEAREHMLSSTPASAGPPEREARDFLPGHLAALR
jgi:hypothetical protein